MTEIARMRQPERENVSRVTSIICILIKGYES